MRKVNSDTIDVWKAKIIEQEHINEMLMDIKEIIIAEMSECEIPQGNVHWWNGRKDGLNFVLEIIDSHISRKENT